MSTYVLEQSVSMRTLLLSRTLDVASGPIPTFVSRLGRHFYECWNQRTTSIIDSSGALDLTFALRALVLLVSERQIRSTTMALTTIPPSSIVGAMLWAGYLGNIIATHLNMIQA
jgi:hypothetical protein